MKGIAAAGLPNARAAMKLPRATSPIAGRHATRQPAGPSRPDLPSAAVANPRRILIVSLDNLGDTVFASALVPPLRERFPDAELGVWCKSYAADVAALIPTVSRVHAADPFWDKAPGRGKGAFLPFVRSLRDVRRVGYDVALLAAAPWRAAAAVRFTGIPVRIGLGRRKNARYLTHALAAEDAHRPVLAEMARLLAPLGIEASGLRYALDRAPLRERLERLGRVLPAGYAALHPFASKRDRCVPVGDWLRVASELGERFPIVWIGSPAELEEVRSAAGDAEPWLYADRIGDGSLGDTAAILAGAAVFAGHDSGPLHVAGAFGVPVVGVFAPGEPDRTFPQGRGPSRMLAASSPREIAAEDILRALNEVVAASHG